MRGKLLGGRANSSPSAQGTELFHDAVDEAVNGAALKAAMARN